MASAPPFATSAAFDPPGGRPKGRRWRGAIAQRLGHLIVSGEYAEGRQFAGEAEAAEALDVSRSAYREAIQFLAAKGLVETRLRTGTRVSSRSNWNLLDPDVLAWTAACAPDRKFLRSLFELRAIVAPAAAALAVARHGPEHLKTMKQAIGALRHHAPATDAHRAADRAFHGAVLSATRNDSFIALAAGIETAVERAAWCRQRAGRMPCDSAFQYARVHKAMVEQDSLAATQAMTFLAQQALADLDHL